MAEEHSASVEKEDYHKVDLAILLGERLKTNQERGLTKAEHDSRLQKYGPNQLTPPKTIPEWVKFLKNMTEFFSLLILAGGVLCIIGYILKKEVENLYLGIVLFAIVIITGTFTYFQEKKSDDLMASFKNMMPNRCTVTRDGNPTEVVAEDLVIGDIVHIKAGDKVPADIRILECSDDMQVDNACLTGESEPCKRSTKCTDANPLETQNMAFFGTQVPKGSCKGVVVATGDNTVMGHIAKLTLNTGSEKTPIRIELDRFISIISTIAITLGVLFFIIGVFLGTDLITNLVFMIGIIVANVPEGLLATITLSLSLTANRMSSKNVLVKNLQGVETLGSTSCICSDKTGTLTQNMMTVANVVYDGKIFDCECSMYSKPTVDPTSDSYFHLLRIAALCNNAKWDENSKFRKNRDRTPDFSSKQPFIEELLLGDGSIEKRVMWKPLGDASESALLKYVQASFDVEVFRNENPKLKEIPFNSTNKYQVSIHQDAKVDERLLVMKGAPERILSRCDKILIDGKVEEFTPELRKKMEDLQTDLSRKGLRVLGFAELPLDPAVYPKDYVYNSDIPNFPLGDDRDTFPQDIPHTEHIFTKLCYVGMMAMIDPPRPQVPPAVETCKTAGIRVIMVTGDHPITAKAIAAKVGIIWGDTEDDIQFRNDSKGLKEGDPGWEDPALAPAIVVPGWDLTPDLPDAIWDDILDHPQVVFARTSPEQKLIIVEHNQKRGEIVTVTGDGVNDAPALRKADIGIAMGIMGSAVSKEAADMILVDDNFASIVKGVGEGRLIFDNLKKSISYTLSSNIPELAPFLCFITIQVPLPLDTILILLIDLGTDMLPAISFAYENAEADIMKRPPRDSKRDRLVNKRLFTFSYLEVGVMQCLAALMSFFFVMNSFGFPASTLPSLGAYDNWGKQTLYCKVEGGNWYREVLDAQNKTSEFEAYNGTAPTSPEEFYTMFRQGYYFWDGGEVIKCHFPSKNFLGPSKSSSNFTLWNEASYNTANGGYTAENTVVTKQSIDVLLQNGYYPYIPLAGRVSPFWDRNWLRADTSKKTYVGLGTGAAASQLHYQPLGYWDINDWNSTEAKTSSSSSEATSAVLSLIDASDYKMLGRKLFSNATFRQTKDQESFEYIYSLSFFEGSTQYANIASRMIQKEALHYSQTAYFITIVIVQIADLLACKTRMNSLIDQGMSNHAMNSSVLFELALAYILLYTPVLNSALRTRPLPFHCWLIPFPYLIIVYTFDEVRKYLMRKTSVVTENPETKQILRDAGWIERNTYYWTVCYKHSDSKGITNWFPCHNRKEIRPLMRRALCVQHFQTRYRSSGQETTVDLTRYVSNSAFFLYETFSPVVSTGIM